MKFVDRTQEKERLTKILNMDRPTFTAIYGRRRLGKSALITRVITDNDIYYLADESEASAQRILLSKVIAQKFAGFDKVTYPDWETLFRSVNYRTEEKFTLVLDELPYMVKQSPELPSVLQKLIDEKGLKYNLVVCGSSQNMMYGLILDESSPLYGRADVVMKFTPIKLPYLLEALNLTAVQAIEEYSVWGGVPRYWELREMHNSLDEAIWTEALSVNGTLYDEPVKLFKDDVQDIVKTATIMSFVGVGANRMSEIASRSNEPATNLSRPIKKLIDLGFLGKDIPFDADEEKGKKTLYKIADPFVDFHYRFVVPMRSFIELGRKAPIEMELQQHFNEHTSKWWEVLCRDAVTGNMIDGTLYGVAKRWWGTVQDKEKKPHQIELDVVAESLDKKKILVGECKWTSGEDAAALENELRWKASMLPFAKGKEIVPAIFAKNITNKSESSLTFTPEDIMELMK